jgi:hypothetical protein
VTVAARTTWWERSTSASLAAGLSRLAPDEAGLVAAASGATDLALVCTRTTWAALATAVTCDCLACDAPAAAPEPPSWPRALAQWGWLRLVQPFHRAARRAVRAGTRGLYELALRERGASAACAAAHAAGSGAHFWRATCADESLVAHSLAPLGSLPDAWEAWRACVRRDGRVLTTAWQCSRGVVVVLTAHRRSLVQLALLGLAAALVLTAYLGAQRGALLLAQVTVAACRRCAHALDGDEGDARGPGARPAPPALHEATSTTTTATSAVAVAAAQGLRRRAAADA